MNVEVAVEAVRLVNNLPHNLTQSMPADLYIPPHALHVILEEVFEGPLDLLLYLIKKHNLDILNIPVAAITHQYVHYIETMEVMEIDLAADYLEMAAFLTEIKSRMLLPRPAAEEEEEMDPRAELIRKLQAYEQIKIAAHELSILPQLGKDFFACSAGTDDIKVVKVQPDVSMHEVLLAFKDILKRVDLNVAHNIERESLTVREKMSYVLGILMNEKFVNFAEFFNSNEGKLGIVVTFLAILEMAREWVIEIVQAEPFAPIYVRLRSDDL
jgi:segregation and condensation protein A